MLDGHEQQESAASKKDFGQLLVKYRQSHSYSQADLARLTRISIHFIEALESNAFEKLPGKVFGRGFIKNICKSLEVDDQEILSLFDEVWPAEDADKPLHQPLNQKKGKTFFPSLTIRSLILIVFLAMISITFLYFQPLKRRVASLLSSEKTEEVQPKETQVEQMPLKSQIPEEDSTSKQTSTPVQPLEKTSTSVNSKETKPLIVDSRLLVFEVTKPVRIKVSYDQKPMVESLLDVGTHDFNFDDHIEFLIFDASAVKITFANQSLGNLGDSGRIRRIAFRSQPVQSPKLL